jgi:hypothetical protein
MLSALNKMYRSSEGMKGSEEVDVGMEKKY